MASPNANFSERTELRSRLCILTAEPSETTRARFDEVCTSPGMAIDMRCTPSGQPTTARIRRIAASRGSIRSGRAHGSTRIDTPSSMPANSSCMVFS